MIVCSTAKEFERALENKEEKIIFEGPKAEEIVKRFQEAENKKKKTRNTAIGVGLLCLLAAPFTAGTSLLGLGATVGAVALSDSVILAIISAVVAISTAAIKEISNYYIEKERNKVILTHK